MSETSISNQVTKILSRFDQKISIPAQTTLDQLLRKAAATESLKDLSIKNDKKNCSTLENSKTLKSLQTIYEASFNKPLTIDQKCDKSSLVFRSKTPDQITPAIKDTHYRAGSPAINKSSTQLAQNSLKFQPKLNKNSLKIASKLNIPKDRLTTSSTPKPAPRDESFTYRPQINKKSQKILQKNPENKPRWDTLYSRGIEKQKEIEKNRTENEEREEKEVLNCSFRPNILQPRSNVNPTQTVERLAVWAKNREIKLKEKKETEAGKDLKECTFMPKITEILNFPETLTEIKGTSRYIQRGKMIKNSGLEETLISQPINRDINKKRYNELVEALHNELQSLEI